MKRIIDYWCDEKLSDKDIREAISIANVENAIVWINFAVPYEGVYTLRVVAEDTIETVKNKMRYKNENPKTGN